ncbi:hypothetical protein D3C84_573630 [compost metagenome]
MAQAQLRDLRIHGFEPVVQAFTGADVNGRDFFCQCRNHQLAQPFVDGGEIVLFQQRWRVRLEQSVFEQQRHYVVQLFDVFDAFGVRQFFQHRNTLAHFAEAAFQTCQLQFINLLGRHLLPVLQAVPDQGCRVAEQQLDLFFCCFFQGTVSWNSLDRALTVTRQRPVWQAQFRGLEGEIISGFSNSENHRNLLFYMYFPDYFR